MKSLYVLPYDKRFRQAFYDVNRAWIEEYFFMTEGDEEILRHPEAILSAGGEIFFALFDETVTGTCAMIRHGNEFELAKMGVIPSVRRTGCGSLLLIKALEFARECKVERVMLETSTKLPHAIALYEKFGFVRSGNEYIHPIFGRKIFKMILEL